MPSYNSLLRAAVKPKPNRINSIAETREGRLVLTLNVGEGRVEVEVPTVGEAEWLFRELAAYLRRRL